MRTPLTRDPSATSMSAAPRIPVDVPIAHRLARRVLRRRLAGLRHGRIAIEDAGATLRFGADGGEGDLQARVRVADSRFYASVLLGGSVGAAESYVRGEWECDDLVVLVRILARNRALLGELESGLAKLSAPLRKLSHWLRRNTRRGSRRNIEAHYDLGNDFYSLFLDRAMMYSCAIFESEASTLDEASLAKIDCICRKLALSPGDHLLEIGTGWAGFALHAASKYGCRVTTTTISPQQHQYACRLVEEAGLADRIEVLRQDYRELRGQYDKLVSIEMIEAVGHQYLDCFLGKCSQLLKPTGMMLLQAITVADQHYETSKRSVDFIKRYIFPGSFLPSVAAVCQSISRVTDLRLFHLDDITPHYARTLRCWRERFFANLEQVRAMGFAEEFVRLWDYYLCYCEGGFEERYNGDVQMLLVKPFCRRRPWSDQLVARPASQAG